jgi:hypothetical protein
MVYCGRHELAQLVVDDNAHTQSMPSIGYKDWLRFAGVDCAGRAHLDECVIEPQLDIDARRVSIVVERQARFGRFRERGYRDDTASETNYEDMFAHV